MLQTMENLIELIVYFWFTTYSKLIGNRFEAFQLKILSHKLCVGKDGEYKMFYCSFNAIEVFHLYWI